MLAIIFITIILYCFTEARLDDLPTKLCVNLPEIVGQIIPIDILHPFERGSEMTVIGEWFDESSIEDSLYTGHSVSISLLMREDDVEGSFEMNVDFKEKIADVVYGSIGEDRKHHILNIVKTIHMFEIKIRLVSNMFIVSFDDNNMFIHRGTDNLDTFVRFRIGTINGYNYQIYDVCFHGSDLGEKIPPTRLPGQLSLIESFVLPPTNNQSSFDFMLSTHFVRSLNFKPDYNYETYFFNFFFGFFLMIPTMPSIQKALGVEKVMYRMMPDAAGISFAFIIKLKNGTHTLQIRNILIRGGSVYRRVPHFTEPFTQNYQIKIVETKSRMPIIFENIRFDSPWIKEGGESDFKSLKLESKLSSIDIFIKILSETESASDIQMYLSELFYAIMKVYKSHRNEAGLQYAKSVGSDCGFLHGALSALDHKLDVEPFIQHTVFQDEGQSKSMSELFLLLKLKLTVTTRLSSAIRNWPRVVVSFKEGFSDYAIHLLKSSIFNLHGQRMNTMFRLDFDGDTHVSKNSFEVDQQENYKNIPQLMAKITSLTDEIMSTEVPYESTEVNYLSRYIMGMWASELSSDPNLEIFFTGGPTYGGTIFFFADTVQQRKFLLYVRENDIENFKITDADNYFHMLATPIENPTDDSVCDLPIITVQQNYESSNKANMEEFIDRQIFLLCSSVGLGQFESVMTRVSPFSAPDFYGDNATAEFRENMRVVLNIFGDYLTTPEQLGAFVRGLFHKRKFAVSAARKRHSTNLLAFSLDKESDDDTLVVINFSFLDKEARMNDVTNAVFSRVKSSLAGTKSVLFNVLFTANIKSVGRSKRSSPVCSFKIDEGFKNLEHYDQVPRAKPFLNGLGTISNKVMKGLIIRDFLSDIERGDVGAIANDALFLGSSIISSKLGSMAETYGAKLIGSGRFALGTGFRVAGPILQRFASIFVVNHLIDSLHAYSANKNDTGALINVAVDSTFLATDIIETGIEVLEILGAIEGVSAVTGPIGVAIGAVLIIGTSVYEAVKRIESLEKHVQLSLEETISESFRSVFHLGIEPDLQRIINEKDANNYLMGQITKTMQDNNKIKYFFTSSAVIHDGKFKFLDKTLINVTQTVPIYISRSDPDAHGEISIFCPLGELVDRCDTRIRNKDVTTTVIDTLMDVALDLTPFGLVTKLVDECQSTQRITYECFQAFGVENHQNHASDVAFYRLDDGVDIVYGFRDKPNVFHFGNGEKYLVGGDKNDRFLINGDNVNGIIYGYGGYNTLDFSNFKSNDLIFIEKPALRIFLAGQLHGIVKFDTVHEIVGRPNKTERLWCMCELKKIDLKGGSPDVGPDSTGYDTILFDDESCLKYDVTILVHPLTRLTMRKVHPGNENKFTVVFMKNSHSIDLIYEGNDGNVVNLLFQDTILEFGQFISKNCSNATRSCIAISLKKTSTSFHPIKIVLIGKISYHFEFMDGSALIVKPGHIVLVLKTADSVQQIVDKYVTFLKEHKLSMVAFSKSDNTSVTFNHGVLRRKIRRGAAKPVSLNIVYNDPIHKNVIICADGDNVVLVNVSSQTNMLRFKLTPLSIDLTHSQLNKLIVDFSPVADQMGDLWPEYELNIVSVRIDSKLMLTLQIIDAKSQRFNSIIGEVELIGILLDDTYKRMKIANGGIVQKIEINQTNPSLVNVVPEDLIFRNVNRSGFLIYLSNSDVAYDHKIVIEAQLTNYHFYRVNNTLVMSNLDEKIFWDVSNACTVFLENFFQRPKMSSLHFMFDRGVAINLEEKSNEILNSESIAYLWRRIKINDKYYYDY